MQGTVGAVQLGGAEGPCCSALRGWAVLRELQWLRKGRGASKRCLGMTRG